MLKPSKRFFALALLLLTVVFWQQSATTAAQNAATPETVPPPQSLMPTTWDEEKGQTAKINNVDIYYEVYGKGEPLLLLHGGFCNGTYWRSQIPALAEKYQVIVMDSRGHGRSTFDDQPITYELMASDVLGLMDHLGIQKANIVGYSDGGIIGLELAISHRERLKSVIAFGANFDLTGLNEDAFDNPKVQAFFAQAAQDYQALSPQPERWDEFMASMMQMYATEPNYTEDQLKAITTPFLIADGDHDEGIDLTHTKLMASLIPGAKLVIIPNTGHFAIFEKPAEFNQMVLDYLAS
jgi:pimeloyl-ACP methyl ester carboxylesterase